MPLVCLHILQIIFKIVVRRVYFTIEICENVINFLWPVDHFTRRGQYGWKSCFFFFYTVVNL